MANEQTWVLFPGLLTDGMAVDFAAASYSRLVETVTLQTQGINPSSEDLQVQFQLDGVLQAGTYILPAGQKRGVNTVGGGGLVVAAGSVVTAVILLNAGCSDLAVWIESAVTQPGTDDNWVVVTAGDLQSRIAAPEYGAFTSSVIAQGQPDPVPVILSDLTGKVRDAVRSGRKVPLGQPGTVPASLKEELLALAKNALFKRVSFLQRFADGIKADVDDAQHLLHLVAKGDWTVEMPTNPLGSETPNTGAWGSDGQLDL